MASKSITNGKTTQIDLIVANCLPLIPLPKSINQVTGRCGVRQIYRSCINQTAHKTIQNTGGPEKTGPARLESVELQCQLP